MLTGYALWWLAIAALQTLVLHRFEIGWQLAMTDAGISNLILAVGSFVVISVFRFYQPGAGNQAFRFFFAFSVSGLLCFLMFEMLRFVYPEDVVYMDFLDSSLPVRFMFTLITVMFIMLLNWMWNSLEEQNQQLEQNYAAGRLVREAELLKLRQQLQPHFLFNSLNSVSALAVNDPIKARTMIQQLSDFLRGTIRKDDQEMVNFSDELRQIQLYLDIEKVRFGERLQVELEVTEGCDTMKLPPLILQPLVENAIKFGLYGTTGNVTIRIHVKCADNFLEILIINPYDSDSGGGRAGTGFGLSSVTRRLFLIYSRADLLSNTVAQNEFITNIKIPQSI